MQGVHELADLAPRDVVAKAIMRRMLETGHPHMWLDARHLGAEFWERRFPTILATARSYGVDPVTELIPVAPACHYASGGVRTDLWGRSDVPGLYATGEVACSGVHGANRLASNSPAGRAGLLASDRHRAPGRAARLGRARRRPAHRRAGGRVTAPRAAGAHDRARSACCAPLPGWPTPPARSTSWPASLPTRSTSSRGRPPTCSRSAPRWPTPQLCARRPAARTGARTSPSATTPHCAGHFDVVMSDGETELVFAAESRHGPPYDHARDKHERPPRRARRGRPRPDRRCTAAIDRALAEDVPTEDVTSVATIAPDAPGAGVFAAREGGTVAGLGDRRVGLPHRAGRRRRDQRPGRRRHPGRRGRRA